MLDEIMQLLGPNAIFITGTIVVLLNLYLVFKGTPWLTLLIGNIILSVIMNIIGLAEYDLITVLVTKIGGILVDIIKSIWDAIF